MLTLGEVLARLKDRLVNVRVAERTGGRYLIADGSPAIPIPVDDDSDEVPDDWIQYVAQVFGLDPAFDFQQNDPN